MIIIIITIFKGIKYINQIYTDEHVKSDRWWEWISSRFGKEQEEFRNTDCSGHFFFSRPLPACRNSPCQGWNLNHSSDNTESSTARPPGSSYRWYLTHIFSLHRSTLINGVGSLTGCLLLLKHPCLSMPDVLLLHHRPFSNFSECNGEMKGS